MGETFTKTGRDRHGRQLHRCAQGGRRLTSRSTSAFSGYRFPDEIIALSVRWYLRFRLSYADVAEWLGERGITVDPSTIYDWVHAFTPRFLEAARRHRHPVGRKWRVDETPFKIDGRWRYAFRASDERGQIVDVLLVLPCRGSTGAMSGALLGCCDPGREPHVDNPARTQTGGVDQV